MPHFADTDPSDTNSRSTESSGPEGEGLFTGRFSTAAALERMRMRLLDLSTNNRLLNYRFPKGRALRIIDRSPADLFEHIYINGKDVPIVPVPEPPKELYEDHEGKLLKPDVREYARYLGLNVEYETPAAAAAGASTDAQTLHYPEDLERLLRKIDQTARTAVEESGANMLYLVFGYLEWRDVQGSDRELLAPLLILPVALKRTGVDQKTGYFKYSLEYTGEDLTDNITLREKLRKEFSLELPRLEDEEGPEDYFKKIAQFSQAKQSWKVRRYVTLSLLSFGKLLMYLDLDKRRWPSASPIDRHPLVSTLFEGATDYGGDPFAPEYDVDEVSDIPLIADADSSQHSAIIDAMNGKNLVIEGPPGTGKSQTITNLIAAALTKGKTVLFVSEKLAALEVVKRRLDNAGLGSFCLELHSHKTQKRKLLDDIRARLDEVFRSIHGLDQKLNELEHHKQRLTSYASLINSTVGNELGLTVHKVLWASDRYRNKLGDKAATVASAEFSFARTVKDLSDYEEALQQLKRHLVASGEYGPANPWWGYYPDQLLFGDEEAIGRILTLIREAAVELDSFISAFEQRTSVVITDRYDSSREVCARLAEDLPPLTGTEALDLLPELSSHGFIEAIIRLRETISFIRETEPVIDSRFRTPNSVDQEEVEKGRSMRVLAGRLNQLDASSSLISRRASEIREASRELEGALALFMEAARACGLQLKPIHSDLQVMPSIFRVSEACPLSLLHLRGEQWHESGVLETLQTSAKEAEALRAKRDKLQQKFSLNLLPSREELAISLKSLVTQAGLLRFVNPGWWKARRVHNSVRLERATRLKPEQRIEELRDLLSYIDSCERFNRNPELRRLIGSRFGGIDTEFEKYESLAEWYAKAESELRAHSRPGATIDLVRFVVDLQPDVLGWLAARAASSAAAWASVNDLNNKLASFFTTEDRLPNLLVSNDQPLDEVAVRLLTTSDDLNAIVLYIASLFQTDECPRTASQLMNQLLALRAAYQELENCRSTCERLGDRYRGLATDFNPIFAAHEWMTAVKNLGLPEGIENWLVSPNALARCSDIASVASTILSEWKSIDEFTLRLARYGNLNREEWYRQCEVTPSLVRDRAAEALEAIESLVAWADLSRAINRANGLGLESICKPTLEGLLTPDDLISSFRFVLYSSIARCLFRERSELMQFSGLSHEQIRERFRELDKEILQLTQKMCAVEIGKHPVPVGVSWGYVRDYTDRALLQHEIGKKRRHIPIRQLVNRAGAALQALKPCFMMGPLSVAQYLEPGMRSFDLIVMDEASQVKPEDAIGAIARGSQVVVVGDPKQLPPTTFFENMIDDSDEEEEMSALEEVESILDVSLARFQPPRRLRWHYRSQHHSLIHFSNTHFYKDRPLFVFPSPFESHEGLGIHCHFVSDAVYENRQNRREAIEVATAIVEQVRNYPRESLGVVTLNVNQRDLIQDEFDKRLKSYRDVEKYLDAWKEQGEPFFIKNLENVQGDERDVIFISTTYGKNAQGAFYQRFGPITLPTGWRRLNVLFTRAKRRIDLFTSMQPEDIRIDSRSSEGVKALKNYLTFAQTGIIESPAVFDIEPENDFEISVGEVIRLAGYEIVPQLGVAGFYIDIAVRHPDKAGEFLAAVECDGATYHSTRSARDRDRLRQEILETLGWKGKIYRIWSADWFKDPRTQTKRLLGFLIHLREASRDQTAQPEAVITHEPLVQGSLLTDLPAANGASNPVAVTDDSATVQTWDYVTFVYVDEHDSQKSVQIVQGRTDLETGVVGDKMPLARALLGCGIGDEAELNVPGRPARHLKVLAIER